MSQRKTPHIGAKPDWEFAEKLWNISGCRSDFHGLLAYHHDISGQEKIKAKYERIPHRTEINSVWVRVKGRR